MLVSVTRWPVLCFFPPASLASQGPACLRHSAVAAPCLSHPLVPPPSPPAPQASFAQRAKLLGSTAVLEESSSRLESSRRALLETEELGVSILEDLHAQRQTLLHTRDTVSAASGRVVGNK